MHHNFIDSIQWYLYEYKTKIVYFYHFLKTWQHEALAMVERFYVVSIWIEHFRAAEKFV